MNILWINPKNDYTKFPDGHVHMNNWYGTDYDTIAISLKSFDDLFWLAQLKRRYPKNFPNLIITYLLAARCDRKFSDREFIDLKIVAEFINDLKFESVKIHKPHSSVSLALFENSSEFEFTGRMLDEMCKHVRNKELSLGDRLDNSVPYDKISIVAPDAGASKWIEPFVPEKANLIQCNKRRTPGQIDVSFSETPRKYCIILDDLCDGGGTFIALAKQLKERGAEWVGLVVSHAIFSKGFAPIAKQIDMVYTTDSWIGQFDYLATSNLEIFELRKLMI